MTDSKPGGIPQDHRSNTILPMESTPYQTWNPLPSLGSDPVLHSGTESGNFHPENHQFRLMVWILQNLRRCWYHLAAANRHKCHFPLYLFCHNIPQPQSESPRLRGYSSSLAPYPKERPRLQLYFSALVLPLKLHFPLSPVLRPSPSSLHLWQSIRFCWPHSFCCLMLKSVPSLRTKELLFL